jgi:hypothetical protein
MALLQSHTANLTPHQTYVAPLAIHRHLSYHVEYDGLVRRWADTGSLPAGFKIV